MGCGCGKRKAVRGRRSGVHVGATADTITLAERGVMCMTCHHRKGAKCHGAPVHNRVRLGVCPSARFPDARGITKWLGTRWTGVPYPLRVMAEPFSQKGLVPDLPGCGCCRPAKYVWRRLGRLARKIPAVHVCMAGTVLLLSAHGRLHLRHHESVRGPAEAPERFERADARPRTAEGTGS